MYKVFIDNIAKTYEADTESELLKDFDDHKFIEAAGGLVKRGKEFLFIKRHGLWDIPKGKLDEGENIEQCAVREIEEETGIKAPVIIDHLMNTWHTYKTKKGTRVIKKSYWYLLEDKHPEVNLIPQAEEGITEVVFYPPEDFYIVEANTYGSIKEVLATLKTHLSV